MANQAEQAGRKRRWCFNTLPLLCLHVSCPQSYSQTLKLPHVSVWEESIAAELHIVRDNTRTQQLYTMTKWDVHRRMRMHLHILMQWEIDKCTLNI